MIEDAPMPHPSNRRQRMLSDVLSRPWKMYTGGSMDVTQS